MKRLISVLICLALALGLMSGCGSQEAVEEGLDWDAARAKYEPDAVVLTVDGAEADWAEFFYWLYTCYNDYCSENGEITDLNAPSAYDAGMTVGELLRRSLAPGPARERHQLRRGRGRHAGGVFRHPGRDLRQPRAL